MENAEVEPMTSYDPTVEPWINIGLTVVIGIAVIAQA